MEKTMSTTLSSTEAPGQHPTWKPTAAGILNIVAGVSSLGGGVVLVIMLVVGGSLSVSQAEVPMAALAAFGALIGVMALFTLGLGVVSIIGGVQAIQRRSFGWAIAGAAASLLAITPLGVASIIFTALSEEEFAR